LVFREDDADVYMKREYFLIVRVCSSFDFWGNLESESANGSSLSEQFLTSARRFNVKDINRNVFK
jgi:hypothetical protein